jgi:hypothetical protein
MSKGLTISKSIWITIWVVAILQTIIGGIAPPESWRFDIQLPGSVVALFLLQVLGPLATMFGAGGGVFLVAAAIVTNVLVYAGFVVLALLILKVFKTES